MELVLDCIRILDTILETTQCLSVSGYIINAKLHIGSNNQ